MSDVPRYPKVLVLGSTYTENALVGEVILQEKIDGSQLRWGWDEDGQFHVASRNKEIIQDNAGMFKEGVKTLLSNQRKTSKNSYFFGEYLQRPKHNTLKYDATPKNHIVLFDATVDGQWLTRKELAEWAYFWDIDLIPEFYVGECDVDRLKDLNAKTDSYLGGEKIEGVVIKNYGQLLEVHGVVRPLFTKYVREEYKERHQKNPEHRPKKTTVQDYLISFRNENRWLKAIQHLQEDGKLLNEPKDIGALIKLIQQDIEEEEKENIKDFLYSVYEQDIKRIAIRGFPEWYKERLLERIK